MDNKNIFSTNIKKYMEKYDISRRKMSNDLNIGYTTLTDWIKGNNYPRIDKIDILAKYFHTSKANLLEDNIKNPTIKKISNTLPALSEENLKTILRYTDNISDLNDSAINSYLDLSHEAKVLILGFMVSALKDSKKK